MRAQQTPAKSETQRPSHPVYQTFEAVPAPTPRAAPGFPIDAADTGRMVPGWQDFSRYQWVDRGEMCLSALERSFALLHRFSPDRSAHDVSDTLSYAMQTRDSFPAPVRALAARCAEPVMSTAVTHVTAGVVPSTFLAYFELALALDHDDLARQLLARELTHLPDTEDRGVLFGKLLHHLMWVDRDIRPTRVALVESLVEQLDTLCAQPGIVTRAPAAIISRWDGHSYLVEHWMRMGDTARMRAGIEAMLPFYAETQPVVAPLETGGPFRPYPDDLFLDLLYLSVLENGAASPKNAAVIQRAQGIAPERAPALAFQAQILQLYGRSVPLPGPDDGTMWFPTPSAHSAGASANADTVASSDSAPALVPGHLTLLYRFDDDALAWGAYSETYYDPNLNWLHRMQSLYGSRGLDIIVVVSTSGYSPGSLSQSPRDEAQSIRRYLQDHWHINAPLGVVVTPYTRKPRPDERRVKGAIHWDATFGLPGVNRMPTPILLDGQGKVRAMQMSREFFELYIKNLLGQ